MEARPSSKPDLSSLKAAFEAFNQVSGQLQNSYEELQQEVAQLKDQLKTANRKRAEEARRNADLAQRLSSLLEALPGGVVMLDEGGVVREINSAAGDFLGEPLQNHEWTLVCRRAFKADTDEQGDLILNDGRKVTLAQQALEPGPGRVLLLTDVTENRKLQELLSRHRRLAAMGEMAAALAHQIRTPLSAALLYTSNATLNDLTDDRRFELMDKSTRCLHDLEQLINDMLQFARGASCSEEHFGLDDLIDAVENALDP
ncbi:MAG: PAS domain-containing protein, partial [Chlorobiales bacterium]|nr:PAS domain-containing protein [Chlorobiales bacterium]